MVEALFRSPALLDLMAHQSAGQPLDQGELMKAMAADPEASTSLIKAMVRSGQISFNQEQGATNRAKRRRRK